MARTFNGTNDSIEAASAPVTAVPLTMACWFYPVSSAGTVLMAVDTAAGIDRFQIGTIPATFPASCATVQGGSAPSANVAGSIALNQWHHTAGVFSAVDSRRSYINGTGGTVNTGSATPSGVNRVNIGARYAPALSGFFSGRIAEAGIWNVALTADEITSLSKGFPCRLVRPSALVFYSRLIRNVMDIRNGVALSELGTGTTVSDHPRIIYPC